MSSLTKRALADSLKKLMKQSNLDKITIKELVTDCGVNRQTFYYHFKDIYTLVEWIFRTEAIEPMNNSVNYKTWQEHYTLIFKYVENNKEFCINCMHSSGKYYLEKFLYRVTYKLLIDVVEEVSLGTNIDNKSKKFIAEFYCYGFIGIMLTWIRSGFKDNPEKIVKELNFLIEGDIKKAIDKYI